MSSALPAPPAPGAGWPPGEDRKRTRATPAALHATASGPTGELSVAQASPAVVITRPTAFPVPAGSQRHDRTRIPRLRTPADSFPDRGRRPGSGPVRVACH